VFGNNFGPPSNYALNAEDLALFGAISDYWTRFAAVGNPNGHDTGVHWPAFKHPRGHGRGADKSIVLDSPVRDDKRLREAQCDFWEPYFLGSVVGGAVPASSAANDLCGLTIGADLKLDHDLNCAGTGLTVGADGIKIDLNDHTITGSGVGVGIDVTGRTNVSISGGVVKNFEAGVRITRSTDIVVKGNEFRDNGDGVDLHVFSQGNTVKDNAFRDNRARGIMIRPFSSDNTITENTFTGNRVGILVFGGVENTVRQNIVLASVLAGIRLNVIATGNQIIDNTIMSNPAGIDFVVTPTGTAQGNTFVKNTIAMNTCGIKGPVGDNTFKKNHFNGNGANSCP
jgi:parallel beta-helix repeat protein